MTDHEKWLPYIERMCDPEIPAGKWTVTAIPRSEGNPKARFVLLPFEENA